MGDLHVNIVCVCVCVCISIALKLSHPNQFTVSPVSESEIRDQSGSRFSQRALGRALTGNIDILRSLPHALP